MKTTGSKTPRVDAAQKNRTHMTGDDCFWWVQSDFARTLEGELNETRQLLAEKNDTANVFIGQVKKLQSALEKARHQLLDRCGIDKDSDNAVALEINKVLAEPSND